MSIRDLSSEECRLKLRSKHVGRVVFTERALPSAMPVNYLFTDEGVVFRVDPAGLLARLLYSVGDAVLGFAVDEVDDSFESGWSVFVVGLAVRLSEQDAHRFDAAGLRSWGSDNASALVRIPVARMTGRAVESRPRTSAST